MIGLNISTQVFLPAAMLLTMLTSPVVHGVADQRV